MEYNLVINNLRTNPQGFNAIAKLNSELQTIAAQNTDPNAIIKINMSSVNWLDAHLAAPLLLVVRKFQQSSSAKIIYTEIKEHIRSILQKNGFLSVSKIDNYMTTIPITEFSLGNAASFSQFAKQNLSRQEMPKMTVELTAKFYEGIDEIYENSSLHSLSRLNLCAGGQFYPKKGRLDFILSDGGIGFSGAYQNAFQKNIRCIDAIDWALSENNTTRQGDVPGGLGSKIVREFINLNGGRYIIVSNYGYWSEANGRKISMMMDYAFPGTTVILEINTEDEASYYLTPAPDPRDIW